MLSRTVSTFATRSALDRPLSGHSLFGFMMMNVSEMLGGIGSDASSAVPVFEKTNSTSGSFAISCSIRACIADGREECRDRVVQYVVTRVVAGPLKKKKKI